MKNNENGLFFALLIIFLSISLVSAMDVSEYEYISNVKVNCEEYKGYARFELPSEYSPINSPKSYMDIEYFIHKTLNQEQYTKINNWFVKQIDGHSITEVEKIFDKNYESYLVEENKDQIEFIFELPTSSKLDKVSIDLRDSSIEALKVYDESGKEINFNMNTKDFHYELFLSSSIYTNHLRFVIDYEDIIKIKEVAFFKQEIYEEKSYAYIYVDNDCMKDHLFYFGKYGESNSKSGSKSLPVEFDVSVVTVKNGLYDSDFDDDNILNDNDNCLYVSNQDQKDINYNKIGDACEDDDGDGVVNSIDNCIDEYNRDQLDDDGDLIGNVCDDSDERFFEQNKYLLFIFGGIIAIIFFAIALKIMKKKT